MVERHQRLQVHCSPLKLLSLWAKHPRLLRTCWCGTCPLLACRKFEQRPFAHGFTSWSSFRPLSNITALNAISTNRIYSQTLRTTDPRGAIIEVVIGADGRAMATYPDGSTVTMERGPHPLWGMQAPVITALTHTSTGGLTESIIGSITATLADPDDPLSLQTLTNRISVNGREHTAIYDAATRTITSTTPEGRSTVVTIDVMGRVTNLDLGAGLAPMIMTYDAQGRLVRVQRGDESWDYTYDAKNRVVTRTDASEDQIQYAYDDADRLTLTTLPDGTSYGFAYDANGNRTQVIMPSGAVHLLDFRALNLRGSYTPPNGGLGYVRSYDDDRRLDLDTLPGGRTIDYTYDSGGRPTGLNYAEAAVVFEYLPDDPIEQLSRLVRTPTDGGQAQEIAFDYDGNLVTKMTWTGWHKGSIATPTITISS